MKQFFADSAKNLLLSEFVLFQFPYYVLLILDKIVSYVHLSIVNK